MERIECNCNMISGECSGTGSFRTALRKIRNGIVWLLTPEDSRDGFAVSQETGPFPGWIKAVFWFLMAVLVWKGISSL